jgi:hypothetical protein
VNNNKNIIVKDQIDTRSFNKKIKEGLDLIHHQEKTK